MEESETKILIVDDSRVNRSILEGIVADMGYQAVIASDGETAIDRIRTQLPDLVLLDIMMPGISGIEVLEKMKSEPPLSTISVIMLSGNDEIETVVKCIQIGAEDFLTKPLNMTLLNTRIKNCLQRRQAMRQAEKLGQYTLIEKIGQGGMAEVFSANHAMLSRPTALKILRENAVSGKTLDFFEHEVQMTSRLSHPNTVVIYDYGHTPDGRFYYAMEYLPGRNLYELVKSNGPLQEERVLHILMQIASSLAEAHQYGLIHRDIKPENLMLCERGKIYDFVKVLDFGIVKNIKSEGDDSNLSDPDRILGTPPYLSPESITDETKVDGRSDLYSLGAVAYFLLTGKQIFRAHNISAFLRSHIQVIPELPSKRGNIKLSKDFEKLIMKCLEKNPDDRPQNAMDFYHGLEACCKSGKWDQTKAREKWEMEVKHFNSVKDVHQSNPTDNNSQTLEIDWRKKIGSSFQPYSTEKITRFVNPNSNRE